MEGTVTVTNQELQKLTEAIVAELNADRGGMMRFRYVAEWQPEYIAHVGRIVDPLDRAFLIHSPDWAHTPGKVQVSGLYPRTASNEYIANDGPRIGVSINRGARAIAREIMRRFYEPFRAEWDLVAAEVDRRNQSAIDALSVAQTLAELVDAQVRPKGRGVESFGFYRSGNGHGRVSVSSDSVELDLHGLTPLQAARVLNALMSDPVKNVYTQEDES